MDENAGTTEEPTEAPAETPVTPQAPDEVTTLRSRNAGLDAKVTELTKAAKKAQADAAAAAQRLADYEAGKVGSDEALRAQLQAKEAELEAVRRDAQLARIEAKYPETFAVLGEAAALLSADRLAEAEARFKGVNTPEEPTAPKPIGNNPPRTQGGASSANTSPEGETLEQLKARVFKMLPPG